MAARNSGAGEPFFAWPGMASLKLTLPLSYLFSKIFFSVYGGASLLAKLREVRPGFHFDWELSLPFVPSVAFLYLTVPLVLLLTPFILRTWRTFMPFFVTLTVQTLIGGAFFLLLPFSQAYPERAAAGFTGAVFQLADRLNLENNEFPSLHLAFAVTAALVFGRRCGPLGRSLFVLWAVAVAASTLLMHEHHVLDLAAGAVLGLVGVGVVHRKAAREEALEALRIDGLCLKELAWFVRRHPRYLLVGGALLRASIPRWRQTRLLRAAFCLAQHLDDVLDGDRRIKGNPEEYALAVIRGFRGEAPFGESTAEQLARFVASQLARFETARDDPRGELVQLFEVLLEDRRRMDARRALPAAELAEHHRLTFFYSLDLTLVLSGARLRAGDGPELIAALTWVSPVRDLEEDLKKGLINVPAEVLQQDGWNGDLNTLTILLDAPAVVDWLRSEHRRGAAAIQALGARLESIDDPKGRAVLAAFHRALAAYEGKYRRQHDLGAAATSPQPLS